MDCNFEGYDDYLRRYGTDTASNCSAIGENSNRPGFRFETFTDGDTAAARYADDVHRLYRRCSSRSSSKLEVLPAEFVRELARRFGSELVLTFAYRGERVVGFSSAMRTRGAVATLVLGVDYEANNDGNVYFNLIYEYLREVLSSDMRRIDFGAGSDQFKARLGCRQRPNYMYVGATIGFAGRSAGLPECCFHR